MAINRQPMAYIGCCVWEKWNALNQIDGYEWKVFRSHDWCMSSKRTYSTAIGAFEGMQRVMTQCGMADQPRVAAALKVARARAMELDKEATAERLTSR